MDGARERRGGVGAGPQAGQPIEDHVDLQLGTPGSGRRLLAPSQEALEDLRGDVGQHGSAGHRAVAHAVVPGDRGALLVGVDVVDLGAGDDVGPVRPGPGEEGVGDGAHPPDRHLPLRPAVADDVVEEAPVLPQRGVVQGGRGADQGVGGHHAPHHLVGEGATQHLPQRCGDQVLPGVGVDPAAYLLLPGQRLQQRGGDRLREVADALVEGAPGVVLLLGAGEVAEGRPGRGALRVLDQQAGRPSAARDGGVRRGRARSQPQRQVEVGDQLLGHQADEVGVAGEPFGAAPEGLGGDGGAAGVGEALQDQHGPAGPGEVRRGDEPVVPAPDHDDVVGAPACSGHGRPR